MDTFTVYGPNISTAWIRACRELDRIREHYAYHTVVRISDPTREDSHVRAELDRILAAKHMQPVRTVANTIFPAVLAKSARDHATLASRYQAMYPTLRKLHGGNQHGTYFGRLISYPGPNGPTDQIAAIIRRLKREHAGRGPKTACYEVNLAQPDTDSEAPVAPNSIPVYVPGADNTVMGFPCLSHCSFQLDRKGRLHLTALYRSHYMIEKAYGNYLGLGELMSHVADASGLQVGSLTVVAGYAQLDNGCITLIRPMLDEAPPLFAA